jgi:hypothetical protein
MGHEVMGCSVDGRAVPVDIMFEDNSHVALTPDYPILRLIHGQVLVLRSIHGPLLSHTQRPQTHPKPYNSLNLAPSSPATESPTQKTKHKNMRAELALNSQILKYLDTLPFTVLVVDNFLLHDLRLTF